MKPVFASFLAPRPKHPKWRPDGYLSMLALQRRSCERVGWEQVVITDAERLDIVGSTFLTGHLPDSLMPAIIEGQRDLLASDFARGRDIILTGADCLLARDPREVFDGSFELGVTTHPFPDCILNTGAIFVPAGCAALVTPIWERAAHRCGDVWGDDQLSLAAEIRPTLRYGIEERCGLRVAFFPCDTHNRAPDNEEHQISPYVVHFRGPRKDWASRWASRFLGL